MFQDWVSAIFFANYDLIRAERSDGKEYAESVGGERVIFTEERPSHVGKNRFGLPYSMPFPQKGAWANLKKHITAYYGKPVTEKAKIDIDADVRLIETLLKKVDDEGTQAAIQKSVHVAIKKNDKAELERITTKIKTILGE